MRLGLAGENVRIRAKALILGSRAVSRRIADELETLGFQAEVEGVFAPPLPLLADPGAFEALRAMLLRFREAAGDGNAYPHLLHPGVSPWADRPELISIGQEVGLSVVCPPARVISQFTNKLSLFVEAEGLGIPNLAVGFDPIHSIREIEAYMVGEKVHFPFVLKSIRGGGGHGIFVVHGPEDLQSRLPLWLEQLRRNAGEVMLLVERYIEGARRIVAPFARFKDGGARVFPLVDASLQSRFRKLIEFCPASRLTPELEAQIIEWTTRLADHCGYVGVGALEFFVDADRVYLIEGLARLNTGFRLWEEVAGTQAVNWQLAALDLGALPPGVGVNEADRPEWTHAAGLRIYAEDSVLQLPQPGKIQELSERRHWKFPKAEGILDLSVTQGQTLVSDGDPLIGQLTVGALDATQATLVARGILDEFWIAGSLQTNDRYLIEILLHPWVQGGMYHASFIEEEFIPEIRPPEAVIALFGALGAEAFANGRPVQEVAQTESAKNDRWAVGDQWAKLSGEPVAWVKGPEVFETPAGKGLSGHVLSHDGRTVRACVFPHTADRWWVRVGSWTLAVRRSNVLRRAPESNRPLRALVSGRVYSILYRESATVPAHQPLLILESLRSLIPHALPIDARIVEWKVGAEEWVEAGQELASFELLRS